MFDDMVVMPRYIIKEAMHMVNIVSRVKIVFDHHDEAATYASGWEALRTILDEVSKTDQTEAGAELRAKTIIELTEQGLL